MTTIVKRMFVIEQHLMRRTRSEILKMGKHLNMNAMFIKRTLDRYAETRDVQDRPRTGRPRSQRTKKLIKAVREKIRRNPRRSIRKLAKEHHISVTSMHTVCRKDLGTYPYKLQKCQMLSEITKQKRVQRAKGMLKRHEAGTLRNLVFSDEKLFTVEAAFNHQNDRILAKSMNAIPESMKKVRRSQKPASVMVWAAVSSEGRSPLVFIDKGVKINKEVYVKEILEGALVPWTNSLYSDGDWTFQQDGATSHTANITQRWCKDHCPRFLPKEEWPPCSPDLNVLDFCVWSVLEKEACATPATSLNVLKERLVKTWSNIDQNIFRAAVNDFPRRLKAVIKSKGDHFE